MATNARDPPHWTLNSCFGALHGVWVHLGSFRNCMKLDAKQGELVQLMQKFVPRSYVGIFCTERTQSTPLDPKLMFWCVCTILVYFGPFGCLMKLGAKQAELVQKFVRRSRVGIFRTERIRSTPLHCKLTFSCVLYYLGAFGTVWLPYETR